MSATEAVPARVARPVAMQGPSWRATCARHLTQTTDVLLALADQSPRIGRWGHDIARSLAAGGRVLAAGNGGSAAQALHLTSELVGRFEAERRPHAAICLGADLAALTAIVNDYGAAAAFARQVHAHGRPGDVLVALSTSGRSENVLEAARAARGNGILVLALTGGAPNPLTELADDALALPAPRTATVQEGHQVAIHLLCTAIDAWFDHLAPVGAP